MEIHGVRPYLLCRIYFSIALNFSYKQEKII
ncbi:MAG: hypothetical protein H6Q66_158 [Firmicutes bacterium]|nr:hypothetical protein [Bacillota bacterium]